MSSSPLTTAFAATVLVALIGLSQGPTVRNQVPVRRAPLSGRPFPVTLTDVARQAGLTAKSVYGGEISKKYIIEANGSGVAFLDYDSDGRQDLFLVNGSRIEGFPKGLEPTNHLFRNLGAGRFTDVTRESGLARSGWGNGVCVADLDNDGFEDLLVTYWGSNVLYQNNGKGAFEDVTVRSGLPVDHREWGSGCTFLDYDRDGHVDLLITDYQSFDPANTPPKGSGPQCQWKGLPVFCGPRGRPFGKLSLYHNRGDNTFEDVSERAGLRAVTELYAFTPVAVDLNGDGWTDVYVACDSTPSLFFRNNHDGTFTDIAAEAGVAYSEDGAEQGGMGVAVGDFDNDGNLDLLKTNFAGDHSNLYRNLGRGVFEDVVRRAGLAVNPQYVGWGVGFVDLDNDGWKDIVQVNGHVYPELAGGVGGEFYRNPRLVYRNLGGGKFEDVSALCGPGISEQMSSRGAAFGDLDDDGAPDILVMNMGATPSLLRNELKNSNRWIKVKLEGTKSNRSAVGAIVSIFAAGNTQTDAVLSQSSYLSHNDSRLHFGLGPAAKVERFVVRWPSGDVEQFSGSASDVLVQLVEGTGNPRVLPLIK